MTGPALELHPSALAAEEACARRVAAVLEDRPAANLGLATGRTMIGVYRALRSSGVSLARATTFNLDEYRDLPSDHPASFRTFMAEQLFGPAGIPGDRVHFPDVRDGAAAEYEARIVAAGGLDLQLLGIGVNGHIGFNEPGSTVASRTRTVDLSAETRLANAAQFHDRDVPHQAVTMGIATILEARSIVLVATGETKAAALAAALNGPMTPSCPASFLRRHLDVTIIADPAAASRLSRSGTAWSGELA
ncbi:glucosamine-6-phosphate deaminase [Palleronia aestuarii]|uniref:Glucosamine-6-phosphate deaminase n=1 Tax=Palleronia aestuarii TaxID=568105 RepID=A0A2W7MYV2_9RHOB|nr:glucosamine-6-phosphate deaminase [Palleronia aestuarii]PZX13000.1 glucosamine-6-phosphate deaminase [Palleronia aestuarii]